MKRVLIVFCMFCLSMILPPQIQASDNLKDGVLILHISHDSDNPHRLLMTLNMAKLMADDHDVLVYHDIKGVASILKNSPDITYSHFSSPTVSLTICSSTA